MKRFLLISLALCTLAALVFATGCTITCAEDDSMRGCGYECLTRCSSTDYANKVAIVAGVDYSSPEYWVEKTGENEATFYYSFEAYKKMEVYYDFCVMQDGLILYRLKNDFGRTVEAGTVSERINIRLDGYNDEGGSLYVIVNHIGGVLV